MMTRSITLILLIGVLFVSESPLLGAEALSAQVEITFGPGGFRRPAVLVAGEYLYLRIRTEGLSKDGNNKFSWSVGAAIYDTGDNLVVDWQTIEFATDMPFGGNGTTNYMHLILPRELVAGKYHCKVMVIDRMSGDKISATRPISVKSDQSVELINMAFARDEGGRQPAGCCFFIGERGWCHYAFSGVKVDNEKARIKVTAKLLDREMKEIAKEPFVTIEDTVPAFAGRIWGNVSVAFHRPGKFYLVIKVEDVGASTHAVATVPFVVIDPGDD